MKLLILSDLHAEFETFEVPKDLDYDVAILAGDIVAPGRVAARWLRNPARFGDKPIVQIAGNHEYYESVMDLELAEMRQQAEAHGIHFLDRDEVVIAGVRFLGCTLWTDFGLRIDDPGFAGQPVRQLSDRHRSMTACTRYLADYAAIRVDDPHTSNSRGTRRLAPMDTLLIHRRHRAWLRRKLAEPCDGRTVVVTHHAPHRGSLAPRFAEDWSSGGFVSEMPAEFFDVPVLWAHGAHARQLRLPGGRLPRGVQPAGVHELARGVREQGLRSRLGGRPVSDAAFSGKGEIRIAAIRGAELVAFLHESQGDETRSVIIESARPRVSAPSRAGGKATSPRQMLPPPAAALRKQRASKIDDTAQVAMEQIGQSLKLLGLDGLAHRNDLAGAYVVEATAEQIRELAAMPGIQAIRLNRRHRIIRAS